MKLKELIKTNTLKSKPKDSFNKYICDIIAKACMQKHSNHKQAKTRLLVRVGSCFCLVVLLYSPTIHRASEMASRLGLGLAPKILLNNGIKIPILGLGTAKSIKLEGEEAVKIAIDCGYRLIDTAYVYGNEEEIGRAIKQKIDEGVVDRDELFITTKLAPIHQDPKLVEHSCRLSLRRLSLDYIDLFLIHSPWGLEYTGDNDIEKGKQASNVDYLDTWKAMEDLVELGLVKSIGVSNFNIAQCERILKNCRIQPTVNQTECHPELNETELINFSTANDIVVMGYCPLGRVNIDKKTPSFLFDETAKKLEEKYRKTPTQICLRYLIQKGVIPIPKSVTKQRIESNFDVFDFELEDKDMNALDQHNCGNRILRYEQYSGHKYYPF